MSDYPDHDLAVVVGARVSWLPASKVARTSESRFADCGHDVWLTAEGRRMVHDLNALVVCEGCAPAGVDVADPSPAQREELHGVGMTDADIAAALATVRKRGIRP